MRRLLIVALALTLSVASAQGTSRFALVVGNAAYPGARLPTSANDAGLVAETLAQAGFDVTAMANATGAMLGRAVQAFAAKAKDAGPDATIVVYLAGRGAQRDGENFFVPIDAKIVRGADVATQAMPMSDLTKALDATPAKTRVYIYDLARSNSFASDDDMPLASGLALVSGAKGTLSAFNAAPGTVAPVDLAPYGVYARALCEMIQTPGLPLAVLFARVRLRVGELTDGAVMPWEESAVDDTPLVPSATTVPPASTASPAKIETLGASEAYSVVVARDTLAGYQDFLRAFPRDALTARVAFIAAVRREALFWSAASRANEPRAFWTYMRFYPRGAHYYDARRRLAALSASLEPPPRFDIEGFPDLSPPSREEAAAIDRPDLSFDDPDWDTIPAPPAALLPSANPNFYEDLPPPPLVDPLALAIPAPVPRDFGGAPSIFGPIAQPDAASLGELRSHTTMTAKADSVTTTTDAGGIEVSRMTATVEPGGRRAIVQTGSDRAVLSRTTILHDAAGSTVVQTGPGGGVLTKSVTWREADGSASTLVRDGANRVITDVRRNRAGIVVSADDLAAPPIVHHPGLKIPVPLATPTVRAPPAPAHVPAVPPASAHVVAVPSTPSRAPPAPPASDPPRTSMAKAPTSDATKTDATKTDATKTEAMKPEATQPLPAPGEGGTLAAGAGLPKIGPTPPPRPRGTPQKAKPKSKAAPVKSSRKR